MITAVILFRLSFKLFLYFIVKKLHFYWRRYCRQGESIFPKRSHYFLGNFDWGSQFWRFYRHLRSYVMYQVMLILLVLYSSLVM